MKDISTPRSIGKQRVACLALAAATLAFSLPHDAAWARAGDANLIINNDQGDFFTVDTTSTDGCQGAGVGNAGRSILPDIAAGPSGKVYGTDVTTGSIWDVGAYSPSAKAWAAKSPVSALTSASTEGRSAAVAMNSTGLLTAGAASKVLSQVDLGTKVERQLGVLPDLGAGDLAWDVNGDLLLVAGNTFTNWIFWNSYQSADLYRLPSAAFVKAMKGTPIQSADWIQLGNFGHAGVTGITVDAGGRLWWQSSKAAGANGSYVGTASLPKSGGNDTLLPAFKTLRNFSNCTTVPGNLIGMARPGESTTSPWGDTPASPSVTLTGTAGAALSATVPGVTGGAALTVTDPSKLPEGVSVDAKGAITGTPAKAGTYTVPVQDCAGGNCTNGTVTITVAEASTGDPSMTITGVAGAPLTGALPVKADKVTVDTTKLPAGVTVDPKTGAISGTPAAPGTYTSPVTASLGTGKPGQGTLTFKITPAGPTSELSGRVGDPIKGKVPGGGRSDTITATGADKMPPGVTIAADGTVSGTPTAAGTFAVPVQTCAGDLCSTGTVTFTIAKDDSECDPKPVEDPSPAAVTRRA